MKKKIKKLIHKYISIPKYEKELLKKDKEIANFKGAYDYVYKLMHMYKDKVVKNRIKRK